MANDRFIGVGFKGAPTPAATVNDQVIHGNLALNQYPPGGFEISEWLVCRKEAHIRKVAQLINHH